MYGKQGPIPPKSTTRPLIRKRNKNRLQRNNELQKKCLLYSEILSHLCHILKVQELQEVISQYEAIVQQLENAFTKKNIFVGNRQC